MFRCNTAGDELFEIYPYAELLVFAAASRFLRALCSGPQVQYLDLLVKDLLLLLVQDVLLLGVLEEALILLGSILLLELLTLLAQTQTGEIFDISASKDTNSLHRN